MAEETEQDKTYKREMAGVVFLMWLVLTFRMFYQVEFQHIAIYSPLYTSASLPMWTFIGGAFLADWWGKQK
jgi:hypothetical protein